MTLVSLLRQQAQSLRDALAYRFLSTGEVDGEAASLSFSQLERQALAVGAALRASGVEDGARVLLLYPSGLPFLAGFLGAQLGGAVPVPVYPPDPGRWERSAARLRGIVADCGPEAVLTTRAVAELAAPLLAGEPGLSGIPWIATDALDEAPRGFVPAEARPESLAFLQYTSGSTGAPKGVMVTHHNLLTNLGYIRAGMGLSSRSVGVIWLPPYHDMGLIGGLLQPLFTGFPVHLLSPLDFLQRPLRWLELLSRVRGTISGGPNFAYDLCARKATPEAVRGLDLSSWEVAFNGAEPVRPETLRRFAEVFAPAGFRREAFFPCYGLAEATLYISGAGALQGARSLVVAGDALTAGRVVEVAPSVDGARTLISAGTLARGVEAEIVGGAGPLPPGEIGEIYLRGPGIAKGYWNKGAETRQTFRQKLPGREGEFLRTGDLGFLWGGQLFVTGRQKELIILRGQNVYPHDLEQALEGLHPALRPGGMAAFSLDAAGEERVGLALELDRRWEGALLRGEEPPAPLPPGTPRDAEGLIEAVRARLAARAEVALWAAQLVPAGSLPKTSSGKLQRFACRAAFLEDALQPYYTWRSEERAAPEASTEEAPAPAAIYEPFSVHFAKLDRRNTRYRYDLERDIAWDRLDAPGDYSGPQLLSSARMDLAVLRQDPALYSLSQWLIAVSTCARFIALEEALLHFSHQERPWLGPTRSLDILDEEEVKHVATFTRYLAHLRSLRPELAATVDAQCKADERFFFRFFVAAKFNAQDRLRYHYTNWLIILLFEEYTIYIHRCLAAEPEGSIQPAWLSAHKAHAQEEGQHVITDAAYLAALRVSEEERYLWSKEIFDDLTRDFAPLFMPWRDMLLSIHPEAAGLLARAQRATEDGEPGFYAMLRDPAFSRTLAAAPYFAYALQRGARRGAAPAVTARREEAAPLRDWISAWLKTHAQAGPLEPGATFSQYGLDSVQAVSLSGDLAQHIGKRLPPSAAYDYPTVERLAEYAAQVKDSLPVLAPLRRPGPLPLSARQARLWRLAQARPHDTLDHITTIYLLPGARPGPVRTALAALAARHEGLRARFRSHEGAPSCVVEAVPLIPLEEQRATARTEDEWRRALAEAAAEQDRRPVDLAAQTWRATLWHGPEDRAALVLTVHHMVTDGWSMEILWRDFSALYEGARAGRLPVLPPAPQFAEVAAREAAYLQTPDAQARLSWWKERIGAHPQLLAPALPYSFRGEAVARVLPTRVVERVSSVARQGGVSLYLALMAAFFRVQQQRQGEDDILLNTHLFHRSAEEERATVGYFVDLLTLRPERSRGASFAELMRALHVAWVEALENALSIDAVLEALQPAAYAARQMPARVAFNMLSFSSRGAAVEGVARAHDLAPPPGFMFFEQMMVAIPQADGSVSFVLWYNRETVTPEDAAQTLAALCNSLEALAG